MHISLTPDRLYMLSSLSSRCQPRTINGRPPSPLSPIWRNRSTRSRPLPMAGDARGVNWLLSVAEPNIMQLALMGCIFACVMCAYMCACDTSARDDRAKHKTSTREGKKRRDVRHASSRRPFDIEMRATISPRDAMRHGIAPRRHPFYTHFMCFMRDTTRAPMCRTPRYHTHIRYWIASRSLRKLQPIFDRTPPPVPRDLQFIDWRRELGRRDDVCCAVGWHATDAAPDMATTKGCRMHTHFIERHLTNIHTHTPFSGLLLVEWNLIVGTFSQQDFRTQCARIYERIARTWAPRLKSLHAHAHAPRRDDDWTGLVSGACAANAHDTPQSTVHGR